MSQNGQDVGSLRFHSDRFGFIETVYAYLVDVSSTTNAPRCPEGDDRGAAHAIRDGPWTTRDLRFLRGTGWSSRGPVCLGTDHLAGLRWLRWCYLWDWWLRCGRLGPGGNRGWDRDLLPEYHLLTAADPNHAVVERVVEQLGDRRVGEGDVHRAVDLPHAGVEFSVAAQVGQLELELRITQVLQLDSPTV